VTAVHRSMFQKNVPYIGENGFVAVVNGLNVVDVSEV
jgi:hypothetical protein